jgi:hypothetical protein
MLTRAGESRHRPLDVALETSGASGMETILRKIILLACGCGLLFLSGWMLGQNKGSGNDGARWRTLTPFEKNLYALGFSRGYGQGATDAGALALAKMLSSQPPTLTSEDKKQGLAAAVTARKRIVMLGSSSTMGQITDTMTIFYSDFRNVPVCWDDAIIFSAASLRGQAPTVQELNAARKTGAESGCK